MIPCCQINLQRQFGGGEVYAAFVAHALEELGHPSTLFVHPAADFWARVLPAGTRIVAATDYDEIAGRMPGSDAVVLTHTPGAVIRKHLGSWKLACFAHMPAHGRRPDAYRSFDLVLPVSDYVRQGLLAAGLANVHKESLYGVACLDRGPSDDTPVRCESPFDWDSRKLRDRLLGASEFLWRPFLRRSRFCRPQDGTLVLAIVSRITTIKQFPLLFSHLAPILAATPGLRLEIFGSGGYASVRELRQALAPLGTRACFWGQQSDVAKVFRNVDYVMTGLPEREALGLNVIEAQSCGTPVLAVNAPPFTETVLDGVTGYLYEDPRRDGGASFAALLQKIRVAPRLDPRKATDHLAKFSPEAFRHRLADALAALQAA